MKKTIFFLMFVFGISLSAKAKLQTFQLPKKIEHQLHEFRKLNHCDEKPANTSQVKTKISVQHFPLDQQQILLFIGTDDHMCLAPDRFIPTIVGNIGEDQNWKIGKPLVGISDQLYKDPSGNFWLTSSSSTEGAKLYKSFDGFNWQSLTVVPPNPSTYIISKLRINSHVLAKKTYNAIEYYKMNLPYTTQSQWEKIDEQAFLNIKDESQSHFETSWKREDTETHIVLRNPRSKKKILIPKFLNE